MKYSHLFFWSLSVLLIITSSQAKAHPLPSVISSEQLRRISDILSGLEISHQQDFNSIVEATQRWRRKPDQERWEVTDLSIPPEQRQAVRQHLKALNFLDEHYPEDLSFDYAILLGGTVPKMTSRLQQLVKAWNHGVRFKKIIFLSGQRPLIPAADDVENLITRTIGIDKPKKARDNARPHTESEAQKMVFFTTKMSEEMRKLPQQTINSPRVWLEEGRWQRGNTRDSIKAWVNSRPGPGKALIVSSQPHVHYQHEVLIQELRPIGFDTAVTGEAARPELPLIASLDALALWLHNLQKRVNGSGPP